MPAGTVRSPGDPSGAKARVRWAAVAGLVLLAAVGPVAPARAAGPGTTSSPSPGSGTADPTPVAPVLVVHSVVGAAGAHSGDALSGQSWIAATGPVARNASLHFRVSGGASVRPTCTRDAGGRCALGDVGAAGITVPFVLGTKKRHGTDTVTLTAIVTARNAVERRATVRITLAPPAARPPAATKAPGSGHRAAPPPAPEAPTASPSIPVESAASPSPSPILPEIAPAPTPSPTHRETHVREPSVTLPNHRPVSAELTSGGLWGLLLIAGVVIAAVLPARRRQPALPRPEADGRPS
ncbi:hypothetical protein [Actinomadura rayongensis]|uniref:Uncharacterized protein n=1 Tax=Actinomadura rayongensis TaxID=1429076 RepID=A0A6I4W9K1_9ACTN|nr:hypothetical protein [Actinomadura rayongensis]MXQ65853.1 hypothetical protein [Actinomadura rayongensis]